MPSDYRGERTEGQAHRSPEREGSVRSAKASAERRAPHAWTLYRARARLSESFLPLTVVVFEILLAPGS